MANCCTLFNNRRSPGTSHAPWTHGLVEIQNKNPGTSQRIILRDTLENWSTQVHFFEHAHIPQPLSHLHISTYGKVFDTQPRII